MRVSDIRDRIVELGQAGSTPDVDLKARALGWLNSAYHELMDEVVAYAPGVFQKEVMLASDETGKVLLPPDVYRILAVYEQVSGHELVMVSRADLVRLDPRNQAAGLPLRFMAGPGFLQLHPPSTLVVRVVYLPLLSDLEEAGAESSIPLPPPLHACLVWGGLVWSAVFERGFLSQAELLLYMKQWEAAKARVKAVWLSAMGVPPRVQPFPFI